VVGMCRVRHRALMGPVVPKREEMSQILAHGRTLAVPNQETFRGEAITFLVPRAVCCLRREATLRIAAARIRGDPTASPLEDTDLRDRAAMVVLAITAADRLLVVAHRTVVATRDAALRDQAGENRHRAVLAAVVVDTTAEVHRAHTEVPAGAVVVTAAVVAAVEGVTAIGKITL
jgi:hypothetical protein